jgi:hypothetical protein
MPCKGKPPDIKCAESLAGLATPKEKLDADAPAPGTSAGAPMEKAEEDGAGAPLVPAAPKEKSEKSDAAALNAASGIVLLYQ